MALKKNQLSSPVDEDTISLLNGDFDEQVLRMKALLKKQGKAVSEEANRILETMSQLHEQVSEESIRDGLTGLYNRRYFDREKIRQFNLAKKNKEDLTMVMIDVDYFGQVNKQYGHETGDKLLKIVAHSIAQSLRCSDLLFRYGGDEFVLILPQTNYEEALQIARRILSQVPRSMKNVLKGKRTLDILSEMIEIHEMTVSMGLFHHRLPDALLDSPEDFIRFADFAASRAKQSGRNQLTVAILHPDNYVSFSTEAKGLGKKTPFQPISKLN